MSAADENGMTPLLVALLMNKPEIIKMLLQHKDIQANQHYADDDTVLHYAVDFGYAECTKALLTHTDISTNIQNKWHQTPLDDAISVGDTECISALLCIHDRHTRSRDFFGKNILHSALSSAVSLEYLLSTGLFNACECNSDRHNLLMSAAQNNCTASFFLLLNECCFILTAQDSTGETVMHAAILC